MPLPLPNLDDLSWKDLTEEGRSLIPAWSPEWTNYNPSDPGITLIELFAYLSEILIYRLNRVGDANHIEFLRLINGLAWEFKGDLRLAERDSLRVYRQIARAVTPGDFEELALAVNDTLDAASGERIARVNCVMGRNLPQEWEGAPQSDSSADVTVVVVASGKPSSALLKRVREALEPARLLTVRVHVSGPRFVRVGVRLAVTPQHRAQAEAVKERVVKELHRFFGPLTGGEDGRGWPFGRDVYLSEVYQVVARVEGVKQVRPRVDRGAARPMPELQVGPTDQKRLLRNRLNEVEAVDLGPGELVEAGDIDIALIPE